MLACHGSAAAQNGSAGTQELRPRVARVLHDGIVFNRGQTFLIRYGRAALVNAALVPEGKVLTLEGRLVTLPTDFYKDVSPRVRVGLFTDHGKVYLMRNGRVMRVDGALVPQGMVLTAEGRREPLPWDFSGFVRDRAPDGSVLRRAPTPVGRSWLAGPASLDRVPSPSSQAGERRLTPPRVYVTRPVMVPAPEEILMALPTPINLLPPASAAATNPLLPIVTVTEKSGMVKE